VEENNLLELTFNGQFPIDNFSYYFNVNDNDTYNMNGLLTANGISIPYTLTFTVRTLPTADPIDENDINAIDDYYYPVKISFAIEMDPKDYKLNLEPIALKNVIIAEVVDGIINKRF
jgi:polyisoprenoid-binding protein YceI